MDASAYRRSLGKDETLRFPLNMVGNHQQMTGCYGFPPGLSWSPKHHQYLKLLLFKLLPVSLFAGGNREGSMAEEYEKHRWVIFNCFCPEPPGRARVSRRMKPKPNEGGVGRWNHWVIGLYETDDGWVSPWIVGCLQGIGYAKRVVAKVVVYDHP
jgi:hypothetical protein